MIYGVSAWSYHTTNLDLFQMADEAKKAGFDGIEVLDLPCEPQNEIAYAKAFRAHCDEIGLKILSAANGADLLNGCGGDLQAEIERLCRKVDTAEALGLTMMRHDASWSLPDDQQDKTFEDILPRLIEGCRAVTEYAAKRGIRTMTEDHGFLVQGYRRMTQLVEGVNHPNYGTLVDIGNFLCTDDVPVEAVEHMMPYAFHIHCKDFHILPADAADPGEGYFKSAGGRYLRGAIVGQGNVNVKGCLDVAKKAGYNGALVLEFEGFEEALGAIRIGFDNMRKYWENN